MSSVHHRTVRSTHVEIETVGRAAIDSPGDVLPHAHDGDAVAVHRPDGGAVVTLTLLASSAASGL